MTAGANMSIVLSDNSRDNIVLSDNSRGKSVIFYIDVTT